MSDRSDDQEPMTFDEARNRIGILEAKVMALVSCVSILRSIVINNRTSKEEVDGFFEMMATLAEREGRISPAYLAPAVKIYVDTVREIASNDAAVPPKLRLVVDRDGDRSE